MQGGGGFGPPPGPPPGGFGAPPGPPPGGGFAPPPGPPPGGGYGAPPGGGYGAPPGGFGPQPGGNPGANEQLSVVSVGLGAGAIVTSCISAFCCIGWVSVPLGIAAIVTGVMSLQRQKLTGAGGRPLAIAGIACGAVGIVIPVIALIVMFALGIGGGMMQGMSQGLQQH